MTHEYNKAKDYEKLEEKYNDTLLKLNETLGYGQNQFENCKLCQFPFLFEGNMYYDCVNSNNEEVPWCANMIDENKSYIDGQKIDCPTKKCYGCKLELHIQLWSKHYICFGLYGIKWVLFE